MKSSYFRHIICRRIFSSSSLLLNRYPNYYFHQHSNLPLLSRSVVESCRTYSTSPTPSSSPSPSSPSSPSMAIRSSLSSLRSPIWSPSRQRVCASAMHRFMQFLQRTKCPSSSSISNYQDLHRWSISQAKQFWNSVWQFTNLLPALLPLPSSSSTPLVSSAPIRSDNFVDFEFFPHRTLNLAENMLRHPKSDSVCIHFSGEGVDQRSFTHNQLFLMTARIAAALKDTDFVQRGERVAGVVCNTPETVAAMLAVTAIGGVWCSCSPDFGTHALEDRFQQVEPVVLFTTDYYRYKGRQHPCIQKAKDLCASVHSIKRLVVLPYGGVCSQTLEDEGVETLQGYAMRYSDRDSIAYERMGFNDPLFILFSSGTTGLPKCIVHRQGLLLQLMKEHQLHCDVRPGDNVFYYTTCGWMMWNWLVTAMASEANLLLFDGNPVYPTVDVLWQFASKHNCTLFGTSAKFLKLLETEKFDAKERGFDLSALRTVTSTGSPLSAES
eukprot:GHVS01026315.1.p1 GENE.GHVS01026315.1~~GHVS01026315.1.p1  ORF type:complete len:494 (-),score=90.97 GHVS01026315.1:434-1915(-)